MAIFNPTIYKDISGSVGNVTSYKVGKTQIVRAKTGFVKDAKTPKQLQQRARLSLITKLRRSFITILKTGYCTPSGKTCINCFTRDNIGKVNAEDWDHPTLDLLTLSLSGGNLRLPLMEVDVNVEKRLVTFRWKKQPLMPFMAKSDQLVGAVYERIAKKSSCRTRHPERKRRKDMDTTHGLGHEPTNRVRLRCQRERTGRIGYTRAY